MRRHIMHTNYDSIKTILAFEGLRRPSDINTLKLDEEGYIASTTYPWVKQIYEHLEDSSVAAQTALAVWGSDPGQYFQINGMNCINKYHLSKFSCFFPGRTIVSAGDIKRREDCYCIQASSLFNFFFSDIISENDLGFYTPNSINGNTLKSIISLQQDRFRIADLDKVQEGCHLNTPIVDMMYVGLPWLYNARIEDYIELINRYENEFEIEKVKKGWGNYACLSYPDGTTFYRYLGLGPAWLYPVTKPSTYGLFKMYNERDGQMALDDKGNQWTSSPTPDFDITSIPVVPIEFPVMVPAF